MLRKRRDPIELLIYCALGLAALAVAWKWISPVSYRWAAGKVEVLVALILALAYLSRRIWLSWVFSELDKANGRKARKK